MAPVFSCSIESGPSNGVLSNPGINTLNAVQGSEPIRTFMPPVDATPTTGTAGGASPAPALLLDDLVNLSEEQVKDQINMRSAEARGMRAGVHGNLDPIFLSDAISTTQDGTIQWVQLVMAGGGMLGIAHVGFVRALEEAGVRFLGLGGTSAGAINAALVAALRKDPTDVSWEKTFEVMRDCRFDSFEDGDPYFQELRKNLALKASVKQAPSMPVDGSNNGSGGFVGWLKQIPQRVGGTIVMCAARNLLPISREVANEIVDGLTKTDKFVDVWHGMGVHRGTTFRRWLARVMYEKGGVSTTQELLAKMQLPQGTRILKRPDGKDNRNEKDITQDLEALLDLNRVNDEQPDLPLKLVASEVTTQTMVVFPQDADLFYESGTLNAPPADFVRASMSVPLFFRPFKLPTLSTYPALGLDCEPLQDAEGNTVLGANGQPLYSAPIIAADGQPILHANGQPILSVDGVARFGKGGMPVLEQDNKPVLGADGKPILLWPLLSRDGKPVLAADGKPIMLADLARHGVATLGPNSMPVGTNEHPVLGTDGEPIFAAPIIDTNGKRVLGADGQPVQAADGAVTFAPGGDVVLGPDGAPLLGADGQGPIRRAPILGTIGKSIVLADLRQKTLPWAGMDAKDTLWFKRNGFAGKVPRVATFVDGGTLSNFPIALFHPRTPPPHLLPNGAPLMPTVGIQLGKDRSKAPPIRNPIQLYTTMNNTSRHLMDREYLLHNLDYSNIVATVDVNGFDWLDFTMDPQKKAQLFLRGMEAAILFLDGWRQSKTRKGRVEEGKVEENKWERYKRLRQLKADMARLNEVEARMR